MAFVSASWIGCPASVNTQQTQSHLDSTDAVCIGKVVLHLDSINTAENCRLITIASVPLDIMNHLCCMAIHVDIIKAVDQYLDLLKQADGKKMMKKKKMKKKKKKKNDDDNNCIQTCNSRFSQSLNCAKNCLQHIPPNGQTANVCKSRAIH